MYNKEGGGGGHLKWTLEGGKEAAEEEDEEDKGPFDTGPGRRFEIEASSQSQKRRTWFPRNWNNLRKYVLYEKYLLPGITSTRMAG